jgi:hypothetical protein
VDTDAGATTGPSRIIPAVATVTDDDRQQQLAWEARQRPRAAIAAIAAGVLGLAGPLWRVIAFSDRPQAGWLEALGLAAQSGPIGEQPTLQVATFEYYHDHATALIGSGVASGLGLLALAWAITFLAVATRARRPDFIKLAVYITLVGAVLYAISSVLGQVGTVLAVSDFLDGARTVDDARDIGGSTLLVVASLLGQIGPLAVVAGLFLVSLNAMRVGLLTRFLGILGVIGAVLMILPLIPLPVVQSFWIVAVGVLMLGVAPGGLPPAWRTGNAEPWPTAMEAAQRRRAAEDRRQGIVRPEPQPEPEPEPAGRPHPSSKKRKRKRRG